MVRQQEGRVDAVVQRRPGATVVRVTVAEGEVEAINYEAITGPVAVGDTVLLNTTARWLKLGTGGRDFVMAVLGNMANRDNGSQKTGHIIKCRYSPGQHAVLAVEEEESPYHHLLQDGSLAGTPVIVATLHSMVAPAALVARDLLGPRRRIVYVMTDGAALALSYSDLIHQLKKLGLIDATITYGQAFGGDYEAVTLFSALLAAKVVARADVIIVAMGPGNVGTGTLWGTTALEQGTILDAVGTLQGRGVAVPRLSFADPRPRHYGVSHHTLTTLGRVAVRPAIVALPTLSGRQRQIVYGQLAGAGILQRHRVQEHDSWLIKQKMADVPVHVTTMGRTVHDDPVPFAAAAAAVTIALGD